MWPKVLAQLIELLPHAARLLPMADRFFQAKSQGDAETLKAIEGLRSDVGQTTAAHASLYRQINEQGERVAALAEDTRAMRAAVNAAEEHVAVMEKRLATQTAFLVMLLVLTIVLLGLVVALFLKH
jgi:septal ring factor EnvC (AmiA/AmiB activator)